MQNEFAALVDRYASAEGSTQTPFPRLKLHKWSEPTVPLHAVYEPALCIIAQGAKRTLLGGQAFHYDKDSYLVVSVDVPVVGQVIEASAEMPYLCAQLDLDRDILGSLMLHDRGEMRPPAPAPALSLSRVTPELTDALVRLLKVLDKPDELAVLGPLAEREILFRLLQGDQAAKVREIAMANSRLSQVNRAILWIRENFRQSFRIEDLADKAGMSASALHSHFKSVTAMSPVQYQKQLRLQEARRLMLLGVRDAASASFDVGYSSPSQFSREYRRLFGLPPQRDIERLKEASDGLVAA